MQKDKQALMSVKQITGCIILKWSKLNGSEGQKNP